MNPNVVEAQAVELAFVDKELLEQKQRIADEKIKHHKLKLDEVARYEKEEIKRQLEITNKKERERIEAETKRIEDARIREHMEWRARNPGLAAQQDKLAEEQHEREKEIRRVEAENDRNKMKDMAKFAAGAVVGGVIGLYL